MGTTAWTLDGLKLVLFARVFCRLVRTYVETICGRSILGGDPIGRNNRGGPDANMGVRFEIVYVVRVVNFVIGALSGHSHCHVGFVLYFNGIYNVFGLK